VPASVAAAETEVPLVIDLHGIYQCVTSGDTQLYTGWLAKAEEFGFIAVWPQAADEPIGENGESGFQWDVRGPIGARWNAGMCDECNGFAYKGQFVTCCQDKGALNVSDVPNNNADDVGFLREMVAQVAATHPVDTTRVYVTGHSYGCMMAQRVLAQATLTLTLTLTVTLTLTLTLTRPAATLTLTGQRP